MTFTVLIVDDEEPFRRNTEEFLTARGYETRGVGTLADARKALQRGDADVVLLDVNLPDGYGPSLLYETANYPVRPPIILITAYGDIEMAVDAMKNGAHDFMAKPIQFAQLEKSLQRATEMVSMRRELMHLRDTQIRGGHSIIGQSKELQTLLRQSQRAAAASVSVLITGETGTGKEVLAKFIHQSGPRANKPYIAINCAAIQNTMMESELFGYEAGAFTGAERKKHGLMEVADGGILFLDEISSMSMDIQAKLLRALEERAFRRVGGTNLIHVDVQLLAASNRDLKLMVSEGQFREDLYYRLKVVDLHVPTLRERKGDIPELVGHFLRQANLEQGKNVTGVTSKAMEALVAYPWPGNIRELKNSLSRGVLFCDDEKLDLADLPADITRVVETQN